jgi:hypothetical protein
VSQDQKSFRGCVQVRKNSTRVKPVFTINLAHAKAMVFFYFFADTGSAQHDCYKPPYMGCVSCECL